MDLLARRRRLHAGGLQRVATRSSPSSRPSAWGRAREGGPAAGSGSSTLPSLGWLLVFFLVPTLIVFAFAFKPSDPFGGVGAGWTIATLAGILDPQYAAIVWRTVWLSLLTTGLCLLLATPAGYAIARAEPSVRDAAACCS